MNREFVQAIRGPIMLIALGTLVAIDYAGVFGFWRTWPILIILFGLLKLLEHSGAKAPPAFPGEHPFDRQPDPPSGGNVI